MVARSTRRRPAYSEEIGQEPPENNDSGRVWLITFTDLVSLMLTFFVMLFAMSNVKLDEWKNVSDSLSQTLSPTTKPQVKPVTATFNIGTIFRKEAIDIGYLSSILEENVARTEALAGTSVKLLEDQLVLSLSGNLLFQPGRSVLTETAQTALFDLAGVFQNISNQIVVNGHTDSGPPKEADYTSNWELSTARAAAVANMLRQVGYQDEIIALGFADSKFQISSNTQDVGRASAGHRIDIIVSSTVRVED